MNRVVVDTNVLVAANGRGTHVDENCMRACSKAVDDIPNTKLLCLDTHGWILDEYAKRLNHSGQPGIGDAFFKYVRDHQFSSEWIKRVEIMPERGNFHELPDTDDRKFLAVAVKAKAVILNATDSDWEEQKPLLNRLKVKVKQLCPKYKSR